MSARVPLAASALEEAKTLVAKDLARRGLVSGKIEVISQRPYEGALEFLSFPEEWVSLDEEPMVVG